MQIFAVIAFLIILFFVSIRYDKKLVQALPLSLCASILFLYVLAFLNRLSLADASGLLLIVVCVLHAVRIKCEGRIELAGKIRKKISDPSCWVFAVMMLLILIGVREKLVTWWDDYNFWATDVKAIFYDNGFAEKYRNVASEFGDYPPGTQLAKWMFLHLKPASFDEGLMFAGYYFFIFSFLAPFLGYFDDNGIKGVLKTAAAGAVLFLTPSCVEAFYLEGCCADICMAVAFGAFLVSVVNNAKDGIGDKRFGYISAAFYLAVAVICKNTSLIWLLYAFIFTLVYLLITRMGQKSETEGGKESEASGEKKSSGPIKTIFGYFAPACGVYLSWALFCLINKRVARSTVGALKYVSTGVDMPDTGHELINAYVKAFFGYPLHRYNNGIIDISPFAFLILVTVLFVILGIARIITKKECIFFSVYAFAGGAIFYLIDLVCHLTIFADEMQYLDPFAMVSSIERYSAPFSFGMIFLILYFLFAKKTDLRIFAAFAVAVILMADLPMVAKGFLTYREDIPRVLEERNMLIGDDILGLWNKSILLSDDGDPSKLFDIPDTKGEGQTAHYDGSRIMYVRDSSEVSWISHAYISFFMSPISVVYDYEDLENTSIDEMKARATELHAGYIYSGGSLYEN
ncbi:MAG: hypothetical protein K5888_07030 [Lachnospiraceae bacterium]|nr:hypothetical protein [Lachnospiraceae bacterium]